MEVGVEVGNVVGIRRLCRPDDDDFLEEVEGSTSRSFANLLFLLGVGILGQNTHHTNIKMHALCGSRKKRIHATHQSKAYQYPYVS